MLLFLAMRMSLLRQDLSESIADEFEIKISSVKQVIEDEIINRVDVPYSVIEFSDLMEYEKKANQILIITTQFKLEKYKQGELSILNTEREHIAKITETNNDNRRKGQNQIPYKYKFIFPTEMKNEVENYLKENILSGRAQDVVTKFLDYNVAFIEEKYFNILTPFPERTYLFDDGTSIICDLFITPGEKKVIAQYQQNVVTEVLKFRDAYNSFFKDRNSKKIC